MTMFPHYEACIPTFSSLFSCAINVSIPPLEPSLGDWSLDWGRKSFFAGQSLYYTGHKTKGTDLQLGI